MKTNVMKMALVAISLMGIPCIKGMCPILADEILLVPVGNPIDDGSDINPDRHRGAQTSVPCVEINDTCDELTFTSDSTITLAVEIRDEQGTIVLSQELFLTPNASEIISISNLTSGEYTIYLTIEEQIYEGVFSK